MLCKFSNGIEEKKSTVNSDYIYEMICMLKRTNVLLFESEPEMYFRFFKSKIKICM